MASSSALTVLLFCIFSLSIVSATWLKIDQYDPTSSIPCGFVADSSILIKEDRCMNFGSYSITASIEGDDIIVSNCTDSQCKDCSKTTTYTNGDCDNSIMVTTSKSLPFTQYYGLSTVYYPESSCGGVPFGAFIDYDAYDKNCAIPSTGAACVSSTNSKLFCTLPESLFTPPKGPNFSQKFNAKASFVVVSTYETTTCNSGTEGIQIVQQMGNCLVESGSSGFFSENNGQLSINMCDDEVCSDCKLMPLPTKSCLDESMLPSERSTSTKSDNALSFLKKLTDKQQRDSDNKERALDSSSSNELFDFSSIKIEVVKGFPKSIAKGKAVMVNYVGFACEGDINMINIIPQPVLCNICLFGVEFSCDIDKLLAKIAPGYDTGLSTAAIVGIVVVVIAVIGVAVGVLLYIRHKRGDRGRSYFDQAEKSTAFSSHS